MAKIHSKGWTERRYWLPEVRKVGVFLTEQEVAQVS